MSRILAGLGVVALLAAAAIATGCPGGGPPPAYTLTITGSSSSGYQVNGKPNGNLYRLAFDGEIRWDFVNNAQNNESIRIRLGDWELTSTNNCPVTFGQGGGSGCQAYLPNIPNGGTGPISATPNSGAENDGNEPYAFKLYVGLAPEGNFPAIDPELQIDEYRINRLVLLAAALGVGFLGLSWWLRRRVHL